MHLVRLSGLDDEADGRAQAALDQVVVHRRGREQRRDRCGRPAGAVRQDDDVVLLERTASSASAHTQSSAPMPSAPLSTGKVMSIVTEENVVLDLADGADALQVLVGQDRLVDLEPLVPRGALQVEDVRPRPDERHEAHDEFLADTIDRRVRHLREVLLEIGVQQLRLGRQRRDRRVGAHRADRPWPVVAIGDIRYLRLSCV